MNNENIVKCIVELGKVFFPKGKSRIKSGEFGIFVADIIEPIDNCENIYKNIKLKGTCCEIQYGEKYKVSCKLCDVNEKFGNTYEIVYINRIVDLKDEVKQKNFLMSILNENVVTRLYNECENVIELLDSEDVESLSKVKGIGVKSAMRLIEKYKDCKDYSDVYSELGHLGFTSNLIKRLVDYYKSPDVVIDIVKTNPYQLVNVDGIGFKKADEIAAKTGIKGANPNRIKGCILYILNQSGEIGKSFLHYSDLLKQLNDNIGFVEQDIINNVAGDLISKDEVFLSENGEFIGLKKYYNLENKIKTELLRITNSKSKIKINDIEETIKETEREQGFNFTEEQRDAIVEFTKVNVLALTGAAGCVDCDTEFFNGVKWKKISEYEMGEPVMQYNQDGTAELVVPKRYIKNEKDYLWQFETKYGINQCLSDNHMVVYETSKGNLNKKEFSEVMKIHNESVQGFSGKFYTTFKYKTNTKINLTDDEIRLMCAVICDGYFSENYSNINTCTINIKKLRKKERLIGILNRLNLEYHTIKAEKGYTRFVFIAPLKEKEFSGHWYNCNDQQLKVITDEILHWDGSFSNGRLAFSTTNKSTADFVQFAFSSQAYRCKLISYDRTGQIKVSSNGEKYVRKSIEYVLSISDRIKPSIGGFKRNNPNKTKINKYKTKDGFEYCFTVDSGMLVLRRKGCVFITGNCGKTSVSKGMMDLIKNYSISACALSGKAAVRITEATGIEASTIHRLLGFQHGDFTYNKKNQLISDAVFLDEATMVNGELFLNLLEAIPNGCKLVMMGDIQQLTPIGSCQVFADVLNSKSITSCKLTKPHRQAMKSGIIPLSMNIINQNDIFDSTFEGTSILGELKDMELNIYKSNESHVNEVVDCFMREYGNTKDLMETQIIVPMRNKGEFSTYSINLEVQKRINPINSNRKHITVPLDKERFYTIQVGDKVINTKNNYKSKNIDGAEIPVFNGNMGIVKDIDGEFITVDFIGIGELILDAKGAKSLELGYAITIHKSQGSGFATVIGAIDSSAYVLLNAELLYTLVTRAKKYCVLIGKNTAIRTAIKKREIKNKQTYLNKML